MPELFEQEAVKMETDVAVVEDTNPMIMAAINGKLDAESIKMLIELSNKQEDRRSKQLFDENFAKMQADLKPVFKKKENDFLKSNYAPLDDLKAACDETIFHHGFSYSWDEKPLENGEKIIIMSINGYGHTRTNSWVAPRYDGVKSNSGKNVTNPLQDAGIQSSYGERRTFKAGFGITTTDEDNDGNVPDQVLMDTIVSIETAPDMQMLQAAFADAWNKYKGNHSAEKTITVAKDARKKELSK